MSETFTFGIALAARAQSRDWDAVEALLGLTLASVTAQSDADFRVVIAGHDRPRVLPDDPRFRFLEVDWSPGPPDEFNSDGGRKKTRIAEALAAEGGGLLMLLDADDWVDRHLVAEARRHIGPDSVGGLIVDGSAVDVLAMRALPLPHPAAFDIPFHRICGSSVVGRIDPSATEPVRRDPCHTLGSHHEWPEAARRHGVSLARLPVAGAYLVNTSENHSERHGPHGAWRRTLAERVAVHGAELDDATLARFGLRRHLVIRIGAYLAMRREPPTPLRGAGIPVGRRGFSP